MKEKTDEEILAQLDHYHKSSIGNDFVSQTGHPLRSKEDIRVWQNVIENLYKSNNGPLLLSLSAYRYKTNSFIIGVVNFRNRIVLGAVYSYN